MYCSEFARVVVVVVEIKLFFSILNSLMIFFVVIDLIVENERSHNWSSIHNTPMLLWSEHRWAQEVTAAGFEVLHQWRSGKRTDNEEGTMSIIARNVGVGKKHGDGL